VSLDTPFPWFGGKRQCAHLVWERFGEPPNYVEPFFGSGAVLLGRPREPRWETVNDLDAFVANFWRAIKHAPEEVARWADGPVNENDLHARHAWLRPQREELSRRLEGDPDYHDPKLAGWWCWGLCCWIGSGWCDPKTVGPWVVEQGQLVPGGGGIERNRPHLSSGQGLKRQMPRPDSGRGIERRYPDVHHGRGVCRKRPDIKRSARGVNRSLPYLYTGCRGLTRQQRIVEWCQALADRLRYARVCCGDWSRVLGPTPTVHVGLTGVFLDPPYGDAANRDNALYSHEGTTLSGAVREWAIEHGDDPRLRIALCGYEGEHNMPDTWECVRWKAQGGYGNQRAGDNGNARRERIWFSPHCLDPQRPRELSLFGEEE